MNRARRRPRRADARRVAPLPPRRGAALASSSPPRPPRRRRGARPCARRTDQSGDRSPRRDVATISRRMPRVWRTSRACVRASARQHARELQNPRQKIRKRVVWRPRQQTRFRSTNHRRARVANRQFSPDALFHERFTRLRSEILRAKGHADVDIFHPVILCTTVGEKADRPPDARSAARRPRGGASPSLLSPPPPHSSASTVTRRNRSGPRARAIVAIAPRSHGKSYRWCACRCRPSKKWPPAESLAFRASSSKPYSVTRPVGEDDDDDVDAERDDREMSSSSSLSFSANHSPGSGCPVRSNARSANAYPLVTLAVIRAGKTSPSSSAAKVGTRSAPVSAPVSRTCLSVVRRFWRDDERDGSAATTPPILRVSPPRPPVRRGGAKYDA